MTLTEIRSDITARMSGGVKDYGHGDTAVKTLDGVTVEFERGMVTAIMGPSGSGKSTLLQSIAGLDSLDSGTVHIGDTELGTPSDRKLTELRRTSDGFIFLAFNLIPTLTAEENILLPLTIAGETPDRSWFDQVVTTVGLADRLRHRPSELSGGHQTTWPGATLAVFELSEAQRFFDLEGSFSSIDVVGSLESDQLAARLGGTLPAGLQATETLDDTHARCESGRPFHTH